VCSEMSLKTRNLACKRWGRSGHSSKIRRVLYLIAAGFFFVLGIAGAILPGLPATPFLLLTSCFLLRSSPRLNDRLLQTRLLGPILRDWQVRRSVRPHVKLQALVIIIIAVGATTFLSDLPWSVKAAVVAFAAVGIILVARLPTASD